MKNHNISTDGIEIMNNKQQFKALRAELKAKHGKIISNDSIAEFLGYHVSTVNKWASDKALGNTPSNIDLEVLACYPYRPKQLLTIIESMKKRNNLK